MTKARFLRSVALEELRNDIRKNLDKYRNGDFAELAADSANWFEYDIDIDPSHFNNLKDPHGGNYYEAENCCAVYDALKGLTPYEARDERFWTYLSHTALLQHGRARWPIPSDDDAAVKHIAQHFFARDKRQIERDNIGSRLWWMAHLCSRVPSMKREDALQVLLFRSDVRASIIERPTTSQCIAIFSTLLKNLSLSLDGKKLLFERATYRKLMREINTVGGYKLLDCMPKAKVEDIINEIITEKLNLSAL